MVRRARFEGLVHEVIRANPVGGATSCLRMFDWTWPWPRSMSDYIVAEPLESHEEVSCMTCMSRSAEWR